MLPVAAPRMAARSRTHSSISWPLLVCIVVIVAAIVQLAGTQGAHALKVRPAGEQARQSVAADEVPSFDDEAQLPAGRLNVLDTEEAQVLESKSTRARAPEDPDHFVNQYKQFKDWRMQIGRKEQQVGENQLAAGRPNLHKEVHHDETAEGEKPLSPIILIPGYGGSRLEARRNKPQVVHYLCERLSDWSNIWVDLHLMLPVWIDCLIDDFRLEFDYKTNTTHNTPGVEIRVRDPDDVANVEFLTDFHVTGLGYFASIIRRLTTTLGYKRNHNIRGAPYDFRKAPNELQEFFAKLKRDTEQLYEQFESQPITYICHSMGCNNILYFLQRQPQAWKDKHVARLISLAAPWGGSMQAVRAAVFGDNLGLPYLFDEEKLRIVQMSVPSTMYLFPKERAFQDAPLLSFNADNKQTQLGARDFKRFFEKIDHPSGYLMWQNTKDLLGSLEAPQVEVWCLYGHGQGTLARMEFQGDIPNSAETQVKDDGDGTVTVQSSSYCHHWSQEQTTKNVQTVPLQVGHVEILRNAEVLNQIEAILKAPKND